MPRLKRRGGRPTPVSATRSRVRRFHTRKGEGDSMLWLILGIVLLVIAIAGGTIIHPVLFVLAILALVMFVMRARHA
jgi:hypothetical protein